MLNKHWYGIKSYFKRLATNAYAERVNLKIQEISVLQKASESVTYIMTMIYFHLGGLDLKPTDRDKNHFLTSHPITENLSGKEIAKFAGHCSFHSYEKDEVIFCEQQFSKRFFILVKGYVKLFFGSEKAIEVNAGDVFGDWAMLSDTVRLATAKSNTSSKAIAVDYEALTDANIFPQEIAVKIILSITKRVINRLQKPAQTLSEILIAGGENQKVEFKETLRMNKYTQQKDDRMEFSTLKTVAGFLNSQGGVLFIGVNDEGEPIGLKNELFENTDRLLLHFGHLLHDKLGKNAAAYVKESPLTINDHLILRVDCAPSPEPVFLINKNQQYFFVRQGAQTLSFNIEESVEYIHKHF